jgi:serine/threonine-protein kinase
MLASTYELLEKIGQGGMGIVHRARHRETGEIVAVKIMTADAASDRLLRARFEQEFVAICRLRHPNIVRGIACDMQVEHPYLVMELVEGESLGDRLAREGPLFEDEALRIIGQVAEALVLAHELNLVHRDVKPTNILLTRDGQVRLTDLGLVKDLSLNTDLTAARTGLGTVAYVAPEQADNARLADCRSDIYSLGATLYHALTGIPPFQGKFRAVLLKKQLYNEFIPPRILVPTMHPSVEQAICRALNSCPDKRQQSCREFIASLSRIPLPAGGELLQETRLSSAEQASAALKQGSERRKARRFPCDKAITCGAAWNQGARFRGILQDISHSGAQLLLSRRFEPGANLTAQVLDQEQETVLVLLAQVCWVKKAGKGRWALGCAFHYDISSEDMAQLLGNHDPTVVISVRASEPAAPPPPSPPPHS